MTRNLKVLGLALVAVFAMSAMAASSASAANADITSDGPFKLTGTDEPTGNFLTYPGESPLSCPNSHYVGESQTGGFLASGATTVTVTSPSYTNCKTNSGLPATVTMNGCDYLFHSASAVKEDKVDLTTDLVCPAGKVVEVHIYFDSGHFFLACTLKFAGQAGLKGAYLHDLTNGHLTLGGTVKGIKVTKEGACGAGSTEAAEYDVTVALEGENELGQTTKLSLS